VKARLTRSPDRASAFVLTFAGPVRSKRQQASSRRGAGRERRPRLRPLRLSLKEPPMGKVANAVASKGSDILGSAAKVFPVTGLPLLAYNAYKGAKDTKKEMDALAAQATPDLPKPPPLATPDATDDWCARRARPPATRS
jgi:hypothetical protein